MAKGPTTNNHTLNPLCAFLVPSFDRDAYDGLHLTPVVALVPKGTTCVPLT